MLGEETDQNPPSYLFVYFFSIDETGAYHVWPSPRPLQFSRELGQIVGKSRLVGQLLAINSHRPHLLHPRLAVLLAKWSSRHPHLLMGN